MSGKKLNKRNYGLINFTQQGKIYRRKLKEDKRVNFLKDTKNSIFIFGIKHTTTNIFCQGICRKRL